MERQQRKLAAILAADVAGYSRLMGRDEAGTLAALKTLRREVVDPEIAAHNGRIVKTTGDGLLLEFASVVDAVGCAIKVQTEMAARTTDVSDDQRIAFRIGVNLGDIIVDGDDIFGDGVNVAARLEGIAEAGGICLSVDAWRQVRGKIDAAFDSLGPQSLKNIAQPIDVWRWSRNSAYIAPAVALALPDKPSIAVLPFQNMSGDPEQEYFVDGLVEDIITALSRFKSLFVIARNSSFTYKGKAVDIKQVGRELGVRYVLEGSVRKAGRRVRATGQLIDAATGSHVWADRFEGALEDVFTFQDEVTEKVVAAIAPRVERAEIERAKRRPPCSTDAYDCYLRGISCLSPMTADGMVEAMRLFEQARTRDPNYAVAYAMMMYCHVNRIAFDLVEDIERERSEVTKLLQIVTRIGQEDDVALSTAAYAVAFVLRDLASAKRLIDRAVELNPNLAAAWVNSGYINVWLGHADIALDHLGRAQRLDPSGNPSRRWMVMAHALFFLDRHEEAMAVAEQMLQHSPDAHTGLRIGAASAAFAGRIDAAHRLSARLLSLDPEFSISRFRNGQLGPYRKAEFAEKYAQGLRLAGLPE